MNKKDNRRDTKNRRLQKGEYQRSDGQYEYRYIDTDGERRSVYSWRLVEADRTPNGKRDREPLRIMKRKIEDRISKGINNYNADTVTVNELFDEWLECVCKGDEDSKRLMAQKYAKHIRNGLGEKKAAELHYSDVANLSNKLLRQPRDKKPYTPYSKKYVTDIIKLLKCALDLGVKNKILPYNAAKEAMADIRNGKNTRSDAPRTLTYDKQRRLLEFVALSNVYSQYLPLLITFIDTGCRKGEICGLCWRDINFSESTIHIVRTLEYYKTDGGYQRKIKTPKTSAGNRLIPMTDTLKTALLKRRLNVRTVEPVDGINDFVFSNSTGKAINPQDINTLLKRIVKTYNKTIDNSDLKLPENLYPHMFRHNFATKLLMEGVDPKTTQTLMGHSNTVTTFEYADAELEKQVEAIRKLSLKSATSTIRDSA